MTDPAQPTPDVAPRRRPPTLVVASVVGLVAVLAGGGVALARIDNGPRKAPAAAAAKTSPSTRSGPSNRLSTAPAVPSPPPQSLRGAHLVVGSQRIDEQLVLGQIARLMLQHAGATVTDRTGLPGGSTGPRTALLNGTIDLYWEYTATGWIRHLRQYGPVNEAAAQFDAVAQEDLRENKVRWLAPYAPGNNTYTIAVRPGAAAALGVRTISDVARLARTNPSAVTLCVESDFASHGLAGLESQYGFTIPLQNVRTIDPGAIYAATAKGSSCTFGEVFATDGRLLESGLTRLIDDQHWFPFYNPAVTMRAETYDTYPQIEQVLAPVARALDTDTLTRLNAQVSIDGRDPRSVARAWLSSRGFLS